jgi:hypothetical protein
MHHLAQLAKSTNQIEKRLHLPVYLPSSLRMRLTAMVSTTLSIRHVIMGKKKRKFPFCTYISRGSRPSKGILSQKVSASPSRTMKIPTSIRTFPMESNIFLSGYFPSNCIIFSVACKYIPSSAFCAYHDDLGQSNAAHSLNGGATFISISHFAGNLPASYHYIHSRDQNTSLPMPAVFLQLVDYKNWC